MSFPLTLALFILSSGLLPSKLSAQLTDYFVNVKTKDVYLAGTDNHIEMVIYGTDGTSTGRFFVKGNSERDDLEGFTIRKKDVGDVAKIMLDVDGQLADKWTVEYITVTKGENRENRNAEQGFYEFRINRKLGYNPTDFRYTYRKAPRISVTPDGSMKLNKEYYTKVNFGHNPHPNAPQEIMRYKELWQFVEEVSISESEQTSTGTALSVAYESPGTIYGTFSAEASASWENMVTTNQTSTEQNIQQSEYDWAFVAPANTAVFKKVVFEIPFGYQVFTDGKNSRVVRMLKSQISPAGLDAFLFIPKMENGSVVPMSWETIEREWLAYADPRIKEDVIRLYKNTWLAKGWVTTGTRNQTTNSGNPRVTDPTPVVAPTPMPTPRQGKVNGYTVTSVTYSGSDNGSFEQIAPKIWAEYKQGSRKVHARFKEDQRDEWSVYLTKEDGAKIQLDLHRKQAFFNRHFLFNIIKADAGPGTSNAPSVASISFTNPALVFKDFGDAQGWGAQNYVRTVGDVNGDGKADLIGFNETGTYVCLSSGKGFQPLKKWIDNYGLRQGWTTNNHVRTVGDVNGDGKDDVVGFTAAGVYVSLSTGNSFTAPTWWIKNFGSHQGWTVRNHPRMLGDVNGDGKLDVVGFTGGGLMVSLSNGSSFGTPKLHNVLFGNGQNHGTWTYNHVRTVADINKDGKADIIGFGGNVFTSLGQGNGFAKRVNQGRKALFGNGPQMGRFNVDAHPRMLGDMNGDGAADIIGFAQEGVYVALADGQGSFLPKKLMFTNLTNGAGGWSVTKHPRCVGDVNGDGKLDIIGFGGAGVFVAFAN